MRIQVLVGLCTIALASCNQPLAGMGNWQYQETPDHIRGGVRVVAKNTAEGDNSASEIEIIKEVDGSKWGTIPTLITAEQIMRGAPMEGCSGRGKIYLKLDAYDVIEIDCTEDTYGSYYYIDDRLVNMIESSKTMAVEYNNGIQRLYKVSGLKL